MPLIETSLHVSYQDTQWGLSEAVREIVSNAIDGERRYESQGIGQMSVDYDPKTKVLSVSNARIRVPAKALLMGTSEARGERDAIGTFGEGLPMALLVMARRGLEVVIYNDKEKWEPILHRSDVYEGEQVLAIKTREMIKSRDAFIVEIHDVDPTEYEGFCELFLRLDPTFDESLALKGGYDGEQLLLQDSMKGRIYNKGVYVTTNPKLLFGYDLNLTLNRDRHFVSEWDLEAKTGSVLQYAAENSTGDFLLRLDEKLFSGEETIETSTSWSSLRYSTVACKHIQDKFFERFGPQAIPVENVEQAREAEFYGRRGIIVNPLIRSLLRKQDELSFDYLRSTERLTPKTVWQVTDLTAAETRVLNASVGLVKLAIPNWEPHLRVVEFKGEGIAGTFRKEDAKIDLAREVLLDFKLALSTLVHEVCHSMADDAQYAHSEAQVQMLAKIVESLLPDNILNGS